MSLRDKSLLFSVSIFLLILSSCKSKRNLGQEFVPDHERIGVYSDSVPLELASIRIDSNYTRWPSTFMVGNLDHPATVGNRVMTYTELNYSSLTLDAAAKYDSMSISINSISYVYGDTLDEFELKVFPTTAKLDTTLKYSFQSLPYESTPIAEARFVPSDTGITNIKMRVDSNYAKKILETIKTPASNSDSGFFSVMKGLAFTGSSTQNNSLLLLNRSAIKITLHYSINGTGGYTLNLSPLIDTKVSRSFVHFENQYKGKFASLQNRERLKSSDNDGMVRLQHFSALGGTISIPALDATIGTKEDKILVNKAEIVLKAPKALNTFANSYFNPEYFYLKYASKSGRDVKVGDASYMYTSIFGTSIVASYYDSSSESYRVNVTEYIQKLIDRQLDITDLIIESNAARVVTLGSNDQDPKNFMLKIYYSKLK